jgi:hypothetical protein
MWHGGPWWRWCWLWITPDSSTSALWQFYQQRQLEQVGGMDEGVRILPILYLRYLKGSLTCRKILRHRTSGFTSHLKEGVLRIFIALKNPSPRLGLNPRPLGPVASTLTSTPLRRLTSWYHVGGYQCCRRTYHHCLESILHVCNNFMTTQCHKPDDYKQDLHLRENLKSHIQHCICCVLQILKGCILLHLNNFNLV